LCPAERNAILALLNSERFVDLSPREIYATLLDEGVYVCSWPTMYRILREQGQTRRRRALVQGSAYTKPELLATAPRELWSWDITKLKGPATWTYYYLYVIIDVYSRYVVGWMIAEREAAELAEALIAERGIREQIAPQQLTIHADRGAAMTSKTVAQLLSDLGVAKTHSRPSVSNDNPYSEAQFKTLKYHPSYPARFGSLLDARVWAREFFPWYNQAHHHTALGLLTPAMVHQGEVATVLAARGAVMEQAYRAHPERFVRGAPQPSAPAVAVWINPPTNAPAAPSSVVACGGADSPESDGTRAAVKGGTARATLDGRAGDGYAAAGRPTPGNNTATHPK